MWQPDAQKVGLLRFTIAASLIFFLIYTVAWLFIYQEINRRIKDAINTSAAENIRISQGRYFVHGYPLKPKITFSGELTIKGATLIIPELEIKSFFFSGQTVTLSFPQGLAYFGIIQPPLSDVDFLEIEFITPKFYPDTSSTTEMAKWYQKIGIIKVTDIKLQKGQFEMDADGFVGIDHNLQPRMNLKTTSTGYESLIETFTKTGVISSNEALIASAALNGLSEETAISKKRIVKLDITLENQQLSLGPIPVARLPLFDWDRRN